MKRKTKKKNHKKKYQKAWSLLGTMLFLVLLLITIHQVSSHTKGKDGVPKGVAQGIDKSVVLPRQDFKADEIPTLTVAVVKEPLLSFLGFDPEQRNIASAEFVDPSGKVTPIEITGSSAQEGRTTFNTIYADFDVFSQPGDYAFQVEIEQDGFTKTVRKDFSWGVLAVNVERSVSRPNIANEVSLAVLDEKGQTLCNADLTVTVYSPKWEREKFSTDRNSIQKNTNCRDKSFTTDPDYFFDFYPSMEGRYSIMVNAITENGPHTTIDYFEVVEEPLFDVARSTFPIRIYPPEQYPVQFTVTPQKDFEGYITETVPSHFVITNISDDGEFITLEKNPSRSAISWEVNWKKGETHTLGYTFDAPDISPELFLLGPLRAGDFSEGRSWQIASDAPDGTGILVYDEDGENNLAPHYRTWSGSDFSSAGNLQDDESANDEVNHTIIECNPKADECIRGALNNAGHLDIQIWDGDTDSWINGTSAPTNGDFTTGIGTTNDIYRGFDIAYENTSGEGMVLYEDGVSDSILKYRTWDGSAWSGESNVDFTAVDEGNDVALWVECEADPGSNNILCGWKAAAGDGIYGARWDGSAWQNIAAINLTGSTHVYKDFDLAWEGTSGEGMIVYGTTTGLDGSTYTTGGGWADSAPSGPATSAYYIQIAGSPNNNYIAMMYWENATAGAPDLGVDMWNGSDWTSVTVPAEDVDVNSTTSLNTFTPPMDVAWEIGSSSDRALFAWKDGTTSEVYLRYMVFDIAGHALGSNVFVAPDDDGAGTGVCNLTGTATDDNVATGGLAAAENSNGPCSANTGMSWEDITQGVKLAADPGSRKIMVLATDMTAPLNPEAQLWNGVDAGTWLTQTNNMGAADNSFEGDLSTGGTLSASLPTMAYDFAFRQSEPYVVISGTAYTSHTEGATLNSSGGAIKAVNASTGDTVSDSNGTDGSGLWKIRFTPVPSNGNIIVIYIDGATPDGTLVLEYGASCTGTPDCTGLKLYQDAVSIRSEHTGDTVVNQDMSGCDNDSGTNCADAEIGYTANLSGTYNLSTSSGRELHIWTGDILDPGGTITTDATGGDVHVDDSGRVDFDTATSTVGANLVIDTSATVNVTASTTVTGAAAGGVTVAGTLNQTSGSPTFTIGNGTDEDLTANTGAAVTLSSGTTVIKDDLVMNAGTVAVSNTMDHNDNTTGNIIDLNGGGLTISGGSYTLGGGLEQDGGTATVSTTFTLGGDIDVNTGTLDIDASSNVDFTGVFCTQVGAIVNLDGGTTDGTTASTSHFRFNGGTINLNGGTHRPASGAVVEWARNPAGADCNSDGTTGNTTFNMTGGTIRSRAFLVYGNTYTMASDTVSGGTLELGYGETQANTQLFNFGSSSFQFYNVTVVESGSISGSQTNAFPIKNLFTINSSQDFNLNGEDMTVDGGWVNSGTMTQPSAGTVTLRGGQLTGTGDSKFFNLTVDLASPGTVTVDTDTGADDPTVFGALTVAANDVLAIESSRTVTVDDGGSLTLTGTINGAGRLTYQPTAAFPTGGTIDSILRFDSTLNDQTMSQRTYGGNVEAYSTSGSATRTLTMGTAGGQTINITGSFTVTDSLMGMTATSITNDPTVNITGDFGPCTNLSDGNPAFQADAGTWTVTGAVSMNSCIGSSMSGTHTLTMNGSSKSLTSSTTSWQNLNISGTITLANATHTVKGNLDLTSSTVTAGTSTVNMTGTAHSITGASQSLNNLTINPSSAGTITLQTSGLTVGGTLNVSASDALTINSGITLTHTGATLTLTGTINGPGRLTYRSATTFPTTGILASSLILRMDATSTNQAMGQRTDYQLVEIDNSGTTAGRIVTLGTAGSQIITFNSTLDLLNTGSDPSTTIFEVTTWDPSFTVTGTVTIAANATLSASNTGDFLVGGSWSNSGTFTSNGGTVTFNGTAGTKTIASGGSTFNSMIFNDAGGSATYRPTDALTAYADFTLTDGILDFDTNDPTVQLGDDSGTGNVTFNGGSVTKSGSASVILNDNPTEYDDNVGGIDLGNVQIGMSPATTNLKSDFSATSLTISSGDTFNTHGWEVDVSGAIDCQGTCTFNLTDNVPNNEGNGTIVTFGGNYTMSGTGTFTPSTDSRVEPDGTADQTVTTGSKAFYNFYSNNAGATDAVDDVLVTGAFTINGALTVNDGELELETNDPVTDVAGAVSITSGAELNASSTGSFTVAGNWTNSGSFTSNSGTVTFDGADSSTQLFTGNTTFNNFIASTSGNAAGRTLRFTASSTQTVGGTWTITGFSGKVITLESSSSPTQWTINPTAASVTYVQVSDSNNTGVAFCASFSTDTGNNNTNWQVSATATCGIDIDGIAYANDNDTSPINAVSVCVAVDNVSDSNCDTTNASGEFTITGVDASAGGEQLTFFIDGGSTFGNTVTTGDGSDIVVGDNLRVYQNHVVVRYEQGSPLIITEMDAYDSDQNNTDILYDAEDAAPDTLIMESGNELFVYTGMTFTPGGNVTADDVQIQGTYTATGAEAIAVSGSWDNNGTFTAASSTVTFNSGSTETVEAGSSSFNIVEFANAAGNWTVQTNNMTTAGNLTLTSGTFTLQSGRTLEVQGNFTLTTAAANTTWTGSTLYLNGSGGMYDINTKTHGGDSFATLRIGASEDIAMWDSTASTFTIDSGACLFSEDHGTTAGRLNIYGTCNSRANEYWSYATDFDGAAVTRQADVRFAPSATLTVDSADTLAILGQNAGANRTIVTRESTGNYGLTIDGTINAQYYDFDYTNADGLKLTSTSTVTELSDGTFDNIPAGATSSYITVAGITSTKNFFNNVFDDNADGANTDADFNVNADGSGISWTFFDWSGNKAGETYDNEANGASVRWESNLTLAVNDNVMNLGLINTLNVGTDSHTITVTTNAANGYTCRAVEDGNLRNGAVDINDVADGTVSLGSEEYGMACSGGGCALSGDNAITGSPLTVASSAGPVSAQATTLIYRAAASVITVGTSYSHIVTVTCTGDF